MKQLYQDEQKLKTLKQKTIIIIVIMTLLLISLISLIIYLAINFNLLIICSLINIILTIIGVMVIFWWVIKLKKINNYLEFLKMFQNSSLQTHLVIFQKISDVVKFKLTMKCYQMKDVDTLEISEYYLEETEEVTFEENRKYYLECSGNFIYRVGVADEN